jgi:hypothetical protein
MGIEKNIAGFPDISKSAIPVPQKEALAFTRRLYNATIDAIKEEERWARYSLEKSMTYIIL